MSGDRGQLPAVVDAAVPDTRPALRSSLAVPSMVANAGDRAARRFLEFFAASIENDNTRMAYYRAVCHFFGWIEQHRIGELADIEPLHVAAYIEALQATAAKPTVKQHLAAIRMLFDWLVTGGVLTVAASEQRSQLANRQAARARLAALLRDGIAPPQRQRVPTRPSRAANERRLQAKRNRAAVKRTRRYNSREPE